MGLFTPKARTVLTRNRAKARAFVRTVGPAQAQKVLKRAQTTLTKRIDAATATVGGDSFTVVHASATRAAIQDAVAQVQLDLASSMDVYARAAAWFATRNTMQWMDAIDPEMSALDIDSVGMFDAAQRGAEASLLRMRASMGDGGVYQRYGIATVADFESILQTAVLTGAPLDETVAALTSASPFLQGKPRYWAERIARTEMLGALNGAQGAAMDDLNDDLGDVVKVLVATFDNRTSWDSYLVHGQVRRLNEAFECVRYDGNSVFYLTPPGRPNDREVVVSWRLSWGPLPNELRALPLAACAARWSVMGSRKRPMPPRPPTVLDDELGALYSAPE